jgi:hypothetical protein
LTARSTTSLSDSAVVEEPAPAVTLTAVLAGAPLHLSPRLFELRPRQCSNCSRDYFATKMCQTPTSFCSGECRFSYTVAQARLSTWAVRRQQQQQQQQQQ